VNASRKVITPNQREQKIVEANTGHEISVAAPGQDVRATFKDGSIGTKTGTSEAANLPKLLEIIEATADDVEDDGIDNKSGHGRVKTQP
jgi:hypothetical protein